MVSDQAWQPSSPKFPQVIRAWAAYLGFRAVWGRVADYATPRRWLTPRSSRACLWRAVGVVTSRKPGTAGSAAAIVFRQIVAPRAQHRPHPAHCRRALRVLRRVRRTRPARHPPHHSQPDGSTHLDLLVGLTVPEPITKPEAVTRSTPSHSSSSRSSGRGRQPERWISRGRLQARSCMPRALFLTLAGAPALTGTCWGKPPRPAARP